MSTIAQPFPVQLHSVLFATDFSKASDKPLRHALAIARSYGAKFYLAHVVSSLGLTMAGPDAICVAEDAAERDACHLETELAASGAFDGIQHQIIIRRGEITQELQAVIQQEHVDLVVVGTHGRHGIGKFFLGSIAEQIVRVANCLVLTVGPGSYHEPRVDKQPLPRPFLFATDFGEASLQALPYAISFANQLGASLVLFHAVPTVRMPEDFKMYTPQDVACMQADANTFALQQLKNLVRSVHLDVPPDFAVEVNTLNPVSEDILKAAEDAGADLIIMGLHRSNRIETASHLPWTTAYEVVSGAVCPVLTVKAADRL